MLKNAQRCLGALGLVMCFPVAGLAGPDALTADDARHLLARTGFGAAPHEINALIGTSAEAAVDNILEGLAIEPATPMPAWVDAWSYPFGQIEALGATAEELFYANRYLEVTELQQWWLGEMIATPSPMTERLVLFWHGHFATSIDGVEHPQWLAGQNRFFRAHAAGNFRDLAAGILRDPAMLVYLTNTENLREAPNENLAREYLELFTLGEGRGYTEGDVTEAARALTGHTVDYIGGAGHVFDAEGHDFEPKTIFGATGAYDASDLPDLVLGHPAFGPYIVEALWREFVSDKPEDGEVTRLTEHWRRMDWALRPLLREMLLSDAFWAPEARGRLVKSPIDLLVGSVRSLGLAVSDLGDLAWASEELGQAPFLPPNVGGWPEGRDWLTDATASARATALIYMLQADRDVELRRQPVSMMAAPAQQVVATGGPGDLRVGQVFVTEAFRLEEEDGIELMVTLFDVGFGGHDWRSISLWLGVWPGDTFFLALHRGDCAPDCFADWPTDLDNLPAWIEFEPERGLRRDFRALSEDDSRLLGAILANLPDVLSASAGQSLWSADGEGDDIPLDPNEAQRAVSWVADLTIQALDQTPGALVRGFSRPDPLGLGGVGPSDMQGIDLDDYIEAREDAQIAGVAPRVRYRSARDWLDALPGDGFDSDRARTALLALPLPLEGRRDEMIATDAAALIRHLILSPYYQVK